MTNSATGIGSMPGIDFTDSMQTVLGEVGDFPHLVELPARGAAAGMTGRALALVDGLGADLQPEGWRLTDAPGIDQRRAASLLARDLDTLEELAQDHRGPLKIQVAGPWTLAATVEKPRGDKVVGDHGARRDLAQALVEGLRAHVADLGRRMPRAHIVVQVDEPALTAVLAGAVPTASGFRRHRSVAPADAARSLEWVLGAVRESGARSAIHFCAPPVPFDVLRETSAEALSFEAWALGPAEYDDLGGWVDMGRELWLGVLPATDPAGEPDAGDLTKGVLRWWAELGYTEVDRLPDMTITPTCGLAGASPGWARSALGLAQVVARNVSAEQGRIVP